MPPNLAHRKLIDLAKFGPSSSPRAVLSFTQRFFIFVVKWPSPSCVFVASFAKNESLYRRIWTKYKSSELFWRILQYNKQNKPENEVRIDFESCVLMSRLGYCPTHVAQRQWIPSRIPSRFAFCHQFLAYFDELYQWIHVSVFLTQYFTDKLRNKAFFESKYLETRTPRNWISLC